MVVTAAVAEEEMLPLDGVVSVPSFPWLVLGFAFSSVRFYLTSRHCDMAFTQFSRHDDSSFLVNCLFGFFFSFVLVSGSPVCYREFVHQAQSSVRSLLLAVAMRSDVVLARVLFKHVLCEPKLPVFMGDIVRHLKTD